MGVDSLLSPPRLFFRALKQHPHDFLLDAYLWANVVFLASSVGYVAVDLSSARASRVSDGTYVMLALAYLIDSMLYWVSWTGAWPHPSKTAIAAEYLNVAMSLGYLMTSSMYHAESGPASTDGLLGAVVVIEAIFAAGFVADAIAYAWAWRLETSKRSMLVVSDVGFWVHVFNVVPSLLTMISASTIACGHWLLSSATSTSSSDEGILRGYSTVNLAAAAPEVYFIAQMLNLIADIGYLISACLCFACWFRDLELELFPVDEPRAAEEPAGSLQSCCEHNPDKFIGFHDDECNRPLLARAPSAMQLLRQVSRLISADDTGDAAAGVGVKPVVDLHTSSTPRRTSVPSIAISGTPFGRAQNSAVNASACTIKDAEVVEQAIHSLVVHATSNIRKPLHLQRQLQRGMVDANIVLSASECTEREGSTTSRPRTLPARLPSRANVMTGLASMTGSPRGVSSPPRHDGHRSPIAVAVDSSLPASTTQYSASVQELAAADFDLHRLHVRIGYELLGPCKAVCAGLRVR